MERQFSFHLYANGDDARNFIICEADYYFQFNLVAVCAYVTGVTILGFSIEDSHPHFLLRGTQERALAFRKMYMSSTMQHIRSTRGCGDGVVLDLQLDMIEDDEYLKNAAAYVIVQPTKDGKSVMPYDYKWGTGSMYFRMSGTIPVWRIGEDGSLGEIRRWGSLSYRERKSMVSPRIHLPDEWLVCNGLILPSNYLDVAAYERIFVSFNCFRTFLASGRKQMQTVRDQMARSRGVMLEDLEAREICAMTCLRLFGKRTARWLDTQQRLELAKALKFQYKLSLRQLATLCRLPEVEVMKYLL